MAEVRDTLNIRVEWFNGQDDGDDGQPYYVASCDALVAVTDGHTWAELMHNIHEMIAAAFEGEDTVAAYNLSPNPGVVCSVKVARTP